MKWSAVGTDAPCQNASPNDTHPSFENQTIIITGANTGIGYEAALKFVSLGASKVVLGVRTMSKGEGARASIESATGRKGVIEVWPLDMLDYISIKAFAARAHTRLDQLDIAVLNAGVIAGSFEKSQYGLERTLQVNLVSTTLLSLLLLPKLRASKTASHTPILELVSSGNHYSIMQLATDGNKSPLEVYNESEGFDTLTQYNVSKLFLEYAHRRLASLMSPNGGGESDVIVVSVCPGATKSELGRDIKGPLMRAAAAVFSYLVQRPAEEGARTYISGTQQGSECHGRFWTDDALKEPAPLLLGLENERVQGKVWADILNKLREHVPDLDLLFGRHLS